MNKRFIKWQLKEWMPLLCAILIIFFFTMVVPGLIISTYRDVWVDDVWTWSMNTPSLSRFVIAPMCFAFILPLFVLDYRFNKRKADIYYQLPLKEKELKNTRIVLALVALLVLFTITFFAGMLSTMAHQTSERNWIINAYPGTQLGLYNYGYFALFYLCLPLHLHLANQQHNKMASHCSNQFQHQQDSQKFPQAQNFSTCSA